MTSQVDSDGRVTSVASGPWLLSQVFQVVFARVGLTKRYIKQLVMIDRLPHL